MMLSANVAQAKGDTGQSLEIFRVAGLFLNTSLTEQADIRLTHEIERSTEQPSSLLQFL